MSSLIGSNNVDSVNVIKVRLAEYTVGRYLVDCDFEVRMDFLCKEQAVALNEFLAATEREALQTDARPASTQGLSQGLCSNELKIWSYKRGQNLERVQMRNKYEADLRRLEKEYGDDVIPEKNGGIRWHNCIREMINELLAIGCETVQYTWQADDTWWKEQVMDSALEFVELERAKKKKGQTNGASQTAGDSRETVSGGETPKTKTKAKKRVWDRKYVPTLPTIDQDIRE